jgi:FkbM family methyltransferase
MEMSVRGRPAFRKRDLERGKMRLLKRLELLRGSRRLLTNWRELFFYGIVLRKWGVNVRQPPVMRFRSGLELEMVPGGYGGYNILFHDLFIHKDYEPTPEFVIRRDWTVLDIGANMGFFACPAAIAVAQGRVVAVEPLSGYTDVLRRNVSRNKLKNVTVLQAAATAKSGEQIPLTVWYTKFGELKTGTPKKKARVATEVVSGLTMADIFEQGKIERCDLMKVDIEGAEYALFESVPEHLWKKVDRVIMETHPVSGRDVAELGGILRARGFQVSEHENLLWATKIATPEIAAPARQNAAVGNVGGS